MTIHYRGNLSSAVFPMTLADAGRTVIVPQEDQNFDRRVDPAGEQKDAGIPQAIYMENVLPTANGYQSVGYDSDTQAIPARATGTGTTSYVASFVVDNPNTGTPAIMIQRQGTGSYHDVVASSITADATWQYQATGVRPVYSGIDSTIASVRGVNYWCDGASIFTFTFNASPAYQPVFVDVSGSVTGLTVANVRAICSSYNYLIALMDDGTVHWSSTTTPLDFTASLVTGAGSLLPGEIQGAAKFIINHPKGFILYADRNAIFAQYTGNARYPFKFTPIADAGGYGFTKQIAGGTQSLSHYGIDNSNKIQVLNEVRAELVAPELTTYLERKTYQDTFNSTTNTFGTTNLPTPTMYFILDRYIIVGKFIYDILLQRYGKINVDYVAVVASATDATFIPPSGVGQPSRLVLDLYDTTGVFDGILLLGKFQLVRSRNLKLEEVVIETGQDPSRITANFSLWNFPSFDGKNFLTAYQIPVTNTSGLIEGKTHYTAKSHSLMLKGAFDVNTLQLEFTIAGKR